MKKQFLKLKTSDYQIIRAGVVLLSLLSTTFLSNAQITVSTTQIWTTLPNGYDDGIVVDNGATLTLDGLQMQMKPGTKIEVYESSKLYIINGTLIESDDPQNYVLWGGIYAYGEANEEQFSTFPDPQTTNDEAAWSGVLNNDQTLVYAENSTIKLATRGISSVLGAIVRCNYTDFIDNKTGVLIEVYYSSTYDEVNASYLMDCKFEWNISTFGAIGIRLGGISGVNIGGCDFYSNDFNQRCPINRPTGIYSHAAIYSVGTSGNTFCYDEVGCPTNCVKDQGYGPGCTFSYLGWGVFHNPDYFPSQPDSRIAIRNSGFYNNYSAIYVENGVSAMASQSNIEIIGNEFNSDRSVIDGLNDYVSGSCMRYSNNSIHPSWIQDVRIYYMGATIYDNTFDFDGDRVIHISIDDGSYGLLRRSLIINNEFNNTNPTTSTSDYVYGVYSFNDNSLLKITCNTFDNMGTDIKIAPASVVQTPITGKNGEAAGNLFSDFHSGRMRVDNSGNPSIQYRTGTTIHTDPDYPSYSPVSENITIRLSSHPNEEACNLTCEELLPSENPLTIKETTIEKNQIAIYPNPVNDILIIESMGMLIVRFKVYEVNGREINESTADNYSVKFNTSELKEGVYIIQIMTQDGKTQSYKFMVQR